MKKRKAIRIISLLAAAVVCLGGWGNWQLRRARAAERTVRYQGEYAFAALCEAVDGMDAALQKSRYALSGPMTASLCAEAYARALSAGAALSSLSFPVQELEGTASFLATAGDYAAYLLRKTGGGETLSGEERENIRSLGDAASLLADNLRTLRSDLRDGIVSVAESAAETGLPTLSDSFLEMEQEFPELPTLVYDGPFSTEAAQREPRMTQGAEEIDQDQAALVAAGFLGVRVNAVQVDGTVEGKIPAWRVRSGDYTVYVSRAGGYITEAISSRVPRRQGMTAEAALERARAILDQRGYGAMTESYHIRQEAAMTVTFCARQGNAVCYPDMVKVTVAMDDGSLLRYDAREYLTSHMLRELPRPETSAEKLRGELPEELKVLRTGLAVIPTPGGEEVFCREFVCQNEEERHYLVYFNAVTGEQERILILLEDENGTLSL